VYPARQAYQIPLADGRVLELGTRCLVMGILNVTPDSFAETRPRLDSEQAIAAALRMEQEGADLIDIGGESTRPGATPVDLEEELARVLPVLRGLAGRISCPVSIDTSKAEVARVALETGAVMVNDVTGLRADPELARVITATGAAVVLMHSRGQPGAMDASALYEDVRAEVTAELLATIDQAEAAGISRNSILIDPGIGFAKRPEHSYGVLAGLSDVASALGRPLVLGPSRKSFMRRALGDRPAGARDWGTAAAVTAGVLAGAHIVRVHAVAEMVQVVRVAEEIRRHGEMQNAE
jgi:dihydropteroate synthase